jgi:hypothetical protein
MRDPDPLPSTSCVRGRRGAVPFRQCADAGRGQGRDDGDRVDHALVENAEDKVDDEERCGDEDRRARKRRSECLGVALKARLEREWRAQLFFNPLDGIGTCCPLDDLTYIGAINIRSPKRPGNVLSIRFHNSVHRQPR